MYIYLQRLLLSAAATNDLNENNIIVTEVFSTILNTLQCINDESDRWILYDRYGAPLADDRRELKRYKTETEPFSSKSYRGTRIALSYNDIRNEFDSVLNQMTVALHKELGIL